MCPVASPFRLRGATAPRACHVSSARHVERSVQISRTALTYLLRPSDMGPILLGRLSALANERNSRCVLAMRVASFAPLKYPGAAQQQRIWTAIFLDCPDRTQLGLVCCIVFAMPASHDAVAIATVDDHIEPPL